MGKIVFFNLPGATGHINPTVGLVKQLVSYGENIIYYAGEESRQQFENLGVEFRSYERWFHYNHNAETGVDILKMAFAEIDMTLACIEPLLEITRQDNPDCIIYDPCCVWGKYIGESLDLPTVSSITTLVSSPWILFCDLKFTAIIIASLLKGIPRIFWARRIGMKLMDKTGVEYRGIFYHIFDFFACVGELNIVFNSKLYQPYVDKLTGDFQFVGPSIPQNRDSIHWDFSRYTNKKVIYVSLGTIHNQDIEFYQNIITAFAHEDVEVIMSVGKQIALDLLDPIPSNFTVANFVPQLEVLQHTDVFISHGGMNSLNEALYFNVPVLVVPRQIEQEFNGKRLAKLGVAKLLKKKLPSARRINSVVKELLEDPSYKLRAREYGEELRSSGGYIAAADRILEFIYGTKHKDRIVASRSSGTVQSLEPLQ